MTIGDAPTLAPPVRRRVMLPFMVVTLIWGSTWIVIRDQLGVVPPAWSVSYRFLLAGLAMIGWGLASGQSLRVPGRSWPVVLALGCSLFCGNFQLVYRAEAHVTSGVVAMVFALLVVPNAVLGRIFLGQGLSRPFLVGSAVALVGLGLLFAHEIRADTSSSGEAALGIGLTLAGVFFASIGNIVQSFAPARALTMPALLGWSMLVGSAADALVAAVTVGPPRFEASASYIAGLLYLGLVASALAFPLYFAVLRAIGAARAAYANVLVPIIAMTISTVVENYAWSAESAIGAALVFAGLIFALQSRKPAR